AVSYLPQEPALDPEMTVGETLAYFAALHGGHGRASRERAAALMTRFGLDGSVNRVSGELSGGLRQRLHLVLAFLHGPPLALLDEPTTGLDPGTQQELWRLVADSPQEGSRAVVVSTHDLDGAARSAMRVVVLHEGRVIASGTPRELCEAHGHPRLS